VQVERITAIAAGIVVITLLAAALAAGEAQESQERLAHSNGQGTLRVGDERFKLTAVVVKLIDDRKAELTLVSDITIFLTATWSNHGESQQEIDLDISGDSRGGLEGTGKVVLGDEDRKSVV